MADEDLSITQEEIEKLLQQDLSNQRPQPETQQKSGPGGVASDDPPERSQRGASSGQSGSEAQRPAASNASSGGASPNPPDAGGAPGQHDVDRVPGQTPEASSPTRNPGGPTEKVTKGLGSAGETLAQSDVEYLLNQAERALESIDPAHGGGAPPGTTPFQFKEFTGAPASTESATIDLVSDVELDLKIELGRTQMYLRDILKLRKGSVVPLDKLAGDPVDIYANGRLIARGEVLVLNDNFCIRVGELIAGSNASG
jgi:flagellar motor switch protein FliN/FliY